MLAQKLGMRDGFVDVDRVGRHILAERAEQRERIDPAAVLCFFPIGAQSRHIFLMLARPALPPRVDRCTIWTRLLERGYEQLERCPHVAFKIKVDMEILVDHMPLEGIIVYCDDLAGGGPPLRGVPRRTTAYEQNQIGLLDGFVVAHAEVEWMVGGKVRVSVGTPVDHRDGKQLR